MSTELWSIYGHDWRQELMLDVTEQLRRYAEAAGDVVPERSVARRSRRSWVLTALVAGVVVLAGIVWLADGLNDPDDSQVATGLTEHSLVVPASGATAQQFDDGTPVWVVRHRDASVSVLDAVSTHRPYGAGQVVGWCATSRGFEDPMNGSLFDEHGRNRGGPAPVGLAEYPVTEIDGDTVTVTEPPRSPQRSSAGGHAAMPPAGEHCFNGGGGYVQGFNPGTVELHALATEAPMSLDDAMKQPDGTLVLVDAPVVIVDGRQPVVCRTDVIDEVPPRCDGVAAPELGLPRDQTSAMLHGAFIARPDRGALTDIAYVADRTISAATGGEPSDADPVESSERRPAEIVDARLEGESSVILSIEACNAETNRATVTETEREVVITVTTDDLVLDDMCADTLVVDLEEPLGDRQLVDGTTGEAVTVSSS